MFISSTFSDLADERQDTIRSVLDLGHIPSGMEIFPAADVEQFAYIKKIIDECDYYLLIIGARYGSTDPAGISFTEKEYDYAVAEKKTVLAFIHGAPENIAVSKADVDPVLASKLDSFRKKVANGRLVQFWKTREELKYRTTISLAKAFSETPQIGWIRGNAAASEDLLAQINQLRSLLDDLRSKNHALEQLVASKSEGIADLNENFLVRYTYAIRNRNTPGSKRVRGESVLTWAQIFAAIGPSLIRPAPPRTISNSIISFINENLRISHTSMTVFDSDENTIKMHLVALGLIDAQPAQVQGGGMGEFVSLTEKGRHKLVELMAVKSEASSG